MKSRTILILFVFLFCAEVFAEKNDKGLLPEAFVIINTHPDYRDAVLALNKSIKEKSILPCQYDLYQFKACTTDKSNKIEYILFTDKIELVGVKTADEGLVIRAMTTEEKILASLIKKYALEARPSNSESISLSKDVNTIAPQNFAGVSAASSTSGNIDHCTSSPELFPTACEIHDRCYESSTPKVACDEMFLDDMLRVADIYKNIDFQLYLTYLGTAQLYHYAVVHHNQAWEAYCNSTTNPYSSGECDQDIFEDNIDGVNESNDGTTGGVYTGGIAVLNPNIGPLSFPVNGGSSFSMTVSCEVWRFPDGNGFTYDLLRNCSYHRLF